MPNIAIIGHGFVGKAVEYGFNNVKNKLIVIDPKYGTTISKQDFSDINFVFVCVPTPMSTTGEIDSRILYSVLEELNNLGKNSFVVIIKSTISPDIVDTLSSYTRLEIAINPEFLREKTANEDFVQPPFHVIGSDCEKTSLKVRNLYLYNSNCSYATFNIVTPKEASLIKYSINSFLALKVAFFNQIYELATKHNISYSAVASVVGQDKRIADSHLKVPGFDNKRGFGGSCFPKDTNALLHFSDGELSILQTAVEYNNKLRSTYSLDSRELEQNIRFTYE